MAPETLERVIPWGWWGTDLGTYRPCNSTYQLYSYQSLPPLDESLFRGQFQWLDTSPDEPTAASDPQAVTGLSVALAQRRLALPSSFVDFMSRPELQNQIPSCTACEWDLSPEPIVSPLPRTAAGLPDETAVLVRFLRDQQDCLFWYLYLARAESIVACSPIAFDETDMRERPEEVLANTWWCAPGFEHFVYRFWIENVLWFALNSRDAELTPAQQAYLSHYASSPTLSESI